MPRPSPSKIREFLKEQTPSASVKRARSPIHEALEMFTSIKDQTELFDKVKELGFNEKTRRMHKAWSMLSLYSEDGIEIFVATPGFDDSSCRYLTESNPYKAAQEIM